ncbi:MAG: RHS repeat-associated core domain-containing protein, partial [Planctomycetes bacterium]|nr:RHS repeat-associated core domain-containing protein [Planctomycetota bacterium]
IDYTYDDNDRLISESGPNGTTTYTYDDNGNNIHKSNVGDATDYYYDYENRLYEAQTGTDTMEYGYDADGIRISSSKNTVVTTYLVDKNRAYAQVLVEKDHADNLQVEYIHGDDLISQNRDGDMSYYHYDGQYSTRLLSDENGEITNGYSYDAFGIALEETGETENSYLYTGEQYDAEVSAYYLRARYYSPAIGRFLSFDPFNGSINDTSTLNKYWYSNNNPLKYFDPSGLYTADFGRKAHDALEDPYMTTHASERPHIRFGKWVRCG